MLKYILLAVSFLFAKPDVMLLKVYKDQNITGWVMSEKLDGVRAYWDGKHLFTKNGNVINAPKWFLAGYPPFAVDGELWTKRGDFENISSIVLDKKPGIGWKNIKHMIFDVPDAKGGLFERLVKLKPYENGVIKIIPQIRIQSKEHLKKFFNEVVKHGGEGVVIRDPDAKYERKRSSKILKLKPFKDDECEVVGYTEGKGKYKGLTGALKCRLKDGRIIKIGSGLSLKERKNPPKTGDIITFKYTSFTKNGLPRFPVFLRVRYHRGF
jgi:DNA ligase-1